MSPDSANGRSTARGHDRATHLARRLLSRLTASAAIALLMVGCGTAAGPGSPGPQPSSSRPSVTIARDNANGKTVHIGVGDRLELILSSSYWNVQGSSAPAILRQNGTTSPLPRPSTCPKIPGLGCIPVQTTFTALAPGTAVITANRTTCGEALACGPKQRTFSVTIVVS